MCNVNQKPHICGQEQRQNKFSLTNANVTANPTHSSFTAVIKAIMKGSKSYILTAALKKNPTAKAGKLQPMAGKKNQHLILIEKAFVSV